MEGEELTRCYVNVGRRKAVRWRFDLPTRVRGGLANDSARCSATGQRRKAATRLGQRKETTRVGRCCVGR
jgi:hypothetical protein